ncbi:MAG: F0F1 ATP synthase subunit epsilon [Candidatus Acidiferrales bacterium]
MLPERLELEVVTPERQVVHDSAKLVELPGLDGYLGVLPGHAPLITELGIGLLSYQRNGDTHYLTIVHGYAEVLPDRVIVLAEISERAEEIDLTRATAALERAKERLAKPQLELDWDRAEYALKRALIRVQAAGKGGLVAAAAEQDYRSAH